MRYLIVNHIAAARGRDAAHLRLPLPWARDLAAAASACAACGVSLVIATPIVPGIAEPTVELVPDEAGFEHVELPGYTSARSFLAAREALAGALEQVIATTDVVQLDHGGHPIPLGVVADPVARHLNRRRLWTIAGDQLPDPRLARSARTTARRLIGRPVDARVRRLWAEALRTSDAIVTQDARVTRELYRTLGIGSTPIATIDARDNDCAPAERLSQRRSRLNDPANVLRLAITGEQTIVRGTDHVLRAMQRCRRLGLRLELVVAGIGAERDAFRQLTGELNLADVVRFVDDASAADAADVAVDASLTDSAKDPAAIARSLAGGRVPIAYDAPIEGEGVINLHRGDVDALTAALFEAAMRRDLLIARMLRGVAWARERTIDAAHRRRIELAVLIARSGGRRGAA